MTSPSPHAQRGTKLPGLGRGGRSFYIPVTHPDAHLPVQITEVGESWWAHGDHCERACSPIWALELVLAGELHLEQDGRTTTVGPGQGFLLRRGSRHAYQAGSKGVRKSYVGLEGALVETLLGTAPDLVRWRDPALAGRLFRSIRRHIDQRRGDWQAAASGDAYHLLVEVVRSGAVQGHRERHAVLDRVLPLLEAPDGHACRIADIARVAGLSPAQLHRVFQEEMRTSPRQYANAFAMRRAQHALKFTEDSCTAIAAALGYEPHYFSAVFRRLVGMSPQAFRARHR